MRLDEVETRIAAAIAAITPTAYVQVTGDTWHEAEVSLAIAPQAQPDALAHLAYSVVIERAGNNGIERDVIGGRMRVISTVRVMWCYALRPHATLSDRRLQLRSAGDIVAAVNDDVTDWDGDGDAVASVESPWELVYTVGETETPFQVAAATFTITHFLTL